MQRVRIQIQQREQFARIAYGIPPEQLPARLRGCVLDNGRLRAGVMNGYHDGLR